jgi:hypothetical protein
MRRVLPPLLVTPKASKMVSQRHSISVSRIFSPVPISTYQVATGMDRESGWIAEHS